jgi:hypothetical protein
VLGALEELVVEGDKGEKVTVLDMGRVAFEVTDAKGVTSDLVEGGAGLIARPTVTPWQSLNSRLSAPADLQITLFEELVNPPITPTDRDS